jgi:UDP-N-acetylmuramate--alanine ligase
MMHVHFIGIGGTGLSAMARILVERGYTVSGSDRVLSSLARELARLGVTVYEGHSPANVAGAGLVVRSSAIKDDNPEV